MSSPTPSSSSDALSQLLDKIITTSYADAQSFNLEQLIEDIDRLLGLYDTQMGTKSPTPDIVASVGDVLPSASKFSEEVSKNAQIIAKEISEYSGDSHNTTIAVLKGIGNIHWVAVGLLVVAAVIERWDKTKQNNIKCLKLLKSINGLAKDIARLQRIPLPQLTKEMQTIIKESIHIIVEGAIFCCLQRKKKMFKRFWKSSKYGESLEELEEKVRDMGDKLLKEINLSTFIDRIKCRPPNVPVLGDAFGIEEQVNEVRNLLEWENDKATVAVLIWGIGGAGKTTLADAVWESVWESLHLGGWKCSKVTLIKNLELDPKIEELQSKILEDLSRTKQTVADCKTGRRELKSIMEKENVFIYIDNVLDEKHLKELLPSDVTSPKRFRILVTARTDISSVIENCRIKPCRIHPITPLSVEAAFQVLCREIDRERDATSLLDERPQLEEIAKTCNCCPLFLEVVGGYLRNRKNHVEAYGRVFDWLQRGEAFSCDKKYRFDENTILFSYHQLELSAQDAFLDICSFFSGWEWETVACIVGEEEMKCLEEGALIKRIQYSYGTTNTECVSIHDLLLSAGHNKSKGNRFTNTADFSNVLEEDEKVLSQIKGVWLPYASSPFHVSAEKIDCMSKSLRVLRMNGLVIVEGKSSQRFNRLKFLRVDRGVPNMPIDIGKLQGLTYMDYRRAEKINLSAYKNLSSLKVLACRSGADSICGISGVHFNKLKQLVLWGFHVTEISCLNRLNNLQKLQLWDSELKELPESFEKLQFLQELRLSRTSLKKLPASVCELKALTTMDLENCRNLKNLPRGFHKLSSLQMLNLSYCSSLQELPCHFDKLSSLQSLDICGCSSLAFLPESIGNIRSLSYLRLNGCQELTSLPHSIGEWKSLSKSDISFDACSRLGELPDGIGKLTTVKSISLRDCSSLKMLPNSIGELTALEKLDLSGCSGLSSLPQSFVNLRCLTSLDLSGCANLKELCNDFHLLGALSELWLSGCKSLCKLPVSFGELSGLEILDLSGCSILEELSDTFRCLLSLRRLKLSNCEKLGGKWMDDVAAIQSLRSLTIKGSEKMIQRWTEMQREKEKWHMMVVTEDGEQVKTLLLKEAVSNLFVEEGLFITKDERPFCISSLSPETPLILIIDCDEYSLNDGQLNALENNLQWLEYKSKELKIIYVGTQLTKLNFSRILAYTPDTRAFLFFNEVFGNKNHRSMVFRSKDGLEENCLKCLSMWEDYSYILSEEAFIARTPRDSNIELLRRLLVTEETDFLLLQNNHQVKVNDLQGKMVLLFLTSYVFQYTNANEYVTSSLKDVYVKMRNEYNAEVVWIPFLGPRIDNSEWDKFKKAATNAQWPVVPNPSRGQWGKVRSAAGIVMYSWGPTIVVVDEKGRICCENAMRMIERWGVEAYPFSKNREEEMREAEWKEFQLKPLSALEFVFHNVETTKVKEAIASGAIIFICVGPPEEMLDFTSALENSVKMLEGQIKVFYVAMDTFDLNKDTYEMQRKEICISLSLSLSLSLSDAYKFWGRVEYLQNDFMRMEAGEKIAKVRKMVQNLATAENSEGMSIIVVDENGEVSEKGKEMVKVLCEGGEVAAELVSDMKSGGITSVFEKRWREG